MKKADLQRIDAFQLVLRVPWTARRSNQSILKEINCEYSLEGLMLKLKLQYFGHLMLRADSLEKTDAGKDCRQEEKGATESGDGWKASSTLPTSLSKLRETGIGKPGVLQSMGWQRVGYD